MSAVIIRHKGKEYTVYELAALLRVSRQSVYDAAAKCKTEQAMAQWIADVEYRVKHNISRTAKVYRRGQRAWTVMQAVEKFGCSKFRAESGLRKWEDGELTWKALTKRLSSPAIVKNSGNRGSEEWQALGDTERVDPDDIVGPTEYEKELLGIKK